MRPIADVARELGLRDEEFEPHGRAMAKVCLRTLEDVRARDGKLVLVSAINPTPAGEGKTTTAIGLAMGMRRLGKRAVLALRQPSLGPLFGIKGGGTGGGRATLEPGDDINVHFTGDIHAIASAHNLLSSLVDNAIHWRERFGGSELDIRAVTWGRVLDSEDRFLRRCVIGLGGAAHGVPREERFDIAAASEVMAIVALARDLPDLQARVGRIVAASTTEGAPITAADLGAGGAMTALLRHAMEPNLVQTAEGGPALVHAGPFANIAHGCSSLVATRLAMGLGDYAITEAGFGFDLGGEKFLDIKCRVGGVWPQAVVLVVTQRALRAHGGLDHLDKHLESVASFGLPAIVALNVFSDDSPGDTGALARQMASRGVPFASSDAHERGGEGALDLARVVCEVVDAGGASPPVPRFAYGLDEPPEAKARSIARTISTGRATSSSRRGRRGISRGCDLWGATPCLCASRRRICR